MSLLKIYCLIPQFISKITFFFSSLFFITFSGGHLFHCLEPMEKSNRLLYFYFYYVFWLYLFLINLFRYIFWLNQDLYTFPISVFSQNFAFALSLL